ncbi:MAG: biotin--[acetyl-CoA-carboxylase] ligase [Lachnospiraceae bacterium]|nr:biotin--[acetyl-CoA-carboxylase] ligase [Lachnospiraceae bacterium]
MEYIYYDSIDSTNDEAKRLIKQGKIAGETCLIAKEQTGGRGRQGKSFFSPDSGLYMTVVLPIGKSISSQVTMTVRTACAVSEAIETVTGIKTGIKWVNDIYVRGKKCCGILCEAVNNYEKGIMEYMIAGIGINIATKNWPEELKGIAGSLYEADELTDAEGLSNVRKIHSLQSITDNLAKTIAQNLNIWMEKESNELLKYYRAHSIVLGKEITYIENGTEQAATAIDIDDDGGLIVRNISDNSMVVLRSGEVSVRVSK